MFQVGLASAYFHATLSFAGQMLDELAILWLICAGFSMWLPGRYLPPYLKTNRHMFRWAMFFLTLAGTGLAYVRPVVNAFALMGFGLPISALLINEMRRYAVTLQAICCILQSRHMHREIFHIWADRLDKTSQNIAWSAQKYRMHEKISGRNVQEDLGFVHHKTVLECSIFTNCGRF